MTAIPRTNPIEARSIETRSIARSITIRPIQPRDDAAMAAIIRAVMPEFGAVGDGFAINDPEVDWMHRAYSQPRSTYFVVEKDGLVLGGGGVAPLANGDADTCELRKMYFLPEVRGLGAGSAMIARCLDAARGFGFTRCYLETLCGMDAAIKLYERHGFTALDAPLGDTGHGGCNAFYLKNLSPEGTSFGAPPKGTSFGAPPKGTSFGA